jgi:hypothetical protein
MGVQAVEFQERSSAGRGKRSRGVNEIEGRRLTPPAPSRGVRTVLTEAFGALPRKCLLIYSLSQKALSAIEISPAALFLEIRRSLTENAEVQCDLSALAKKHGTNFISHVICGGWAIIPF